MWKTKTKRVQKSINLWTRRVRSRKPKRKKTKDEKEKTKLAKEKRRRAEEKEYEKESVVKKQS